jgi:hypothetical protein
MVTLIIGSIVNSKISGPLSKVTPIAINQSLGFGFGFAKGYMIVAFVFTAIMSFYSPSSFSEAEDKFSSRVGPEWLTKSKSYDLLLFGSNWIKPIIDDLISKAKNDVGEAAYDAEEIKDQEEDANNDDKKKKKSAISKALKGVMQMQKLNEELAKYKNGGKSDNKEDKDRDSEKPDKGYTEQERQKMQRLIEIMSN